MRLADKIRHRYKNVDLQFAFCEAAMIAAFGGEFDWFHDNQSETDYIRKDILRQRMSFIIAYALTVSTTNLIVNL